MPDPIGRVITWSMSHPKLPILAPNPENDPQFALTVPTQFGPVAFADPRATRALIAIMDMCAVIGGAASHWGGPAAFAEIQSAVHGLAFSFAKKKKKNWSEEFHLINDAGHCENGIYALKANYGFAGLNLDSLLEFRSIQSPLTGHGEVHLFPQGVELSNGPLGSAVAQAQGLAMADRLSGNSRLTVLTLSDGASMEGETREVFASLPGLAAKGFVNPFVMVISDNNTKLSGRIDQESFSMEPTFKALGPLGWDVRLVGQGNDLNEVVVAVEKAFVDARSNPKVPVCLHVKTVKGFGVRSTMDSASGGHGFPLKKAEDLVEFVREIYAPDPVPAPIAALVEKTKLRKSPPPRPALFGKEDKIQVGVAKALIAARKRNLPVVSLTSDLPGSTGVAAFRKEFPQFSFDFGVAEANMVSAAAGFSRGGFIPVVDTFAQFGVTKGALPLTMASLSLAPMICIYSHTGFQDAADGASHQALSYQAMVGSIPHVKIHAFSCATEAETLLTQAIDEFQTLREKGLVPSSHVFFLGRENFPIELVPGYSYRLGQTQKLFDSSAQHPRSVAVVAAGSLVVEALSAAQEWAKQGVGAIVLNPSCLNQIDFAPIEEALNKSQGRLLIAEDHQLIGGLNHALSFEIAQRGLSVRLQSLAVRGEFGQSAYSAFDLYEKHSLGPSKKVPGTFLA